MRDYIARGMDPELARKAALDDGEAGAWLEIVGVVPDFSEDFTTPFAFDRVWPRLYHAAALGEAHPLTLVVQTRFGAPARLAARLREIAATVDRP